LDAIRSHRGACCRVESASSQKLRSEEITMSNINTNTSTPAAAGASGFGEAPIRVGSSFSRPAAIIGGATALVALTAIATTLALRPAAPPAADNATAAVAAQALLPSGKAAPAGDDKVAPDDGDDKPAPKQAAKDAAKPAPAKTAAPRAAAKPQQTQATAAEKMAAVCTTCGVIEAVTPFEQKGEGSGIGAVAGGVIGGVLGNQVGGGNGKKAMTVLGAVGGGMAGHEIEKRQRATTMYSVKVRMEDGTLRSVTQATAPTVGQKVTVEGSQIKARA
jgi:outer membrane lipoprotein SlyB